MTWTVLPKRGVPHLMAVVDDVVTVMHEAAETNNVTLGGLRMSMVPDVSSSWGSSDSRGLSSRVWSGCCKGQMDGESIMSS